MSNKNLTVRLAVLISPEANELVRARARRKGDISKLVEDAIKLAYGPKIATEPAATV